VSLGKVTVLVVGLFMLGALAAPAAAITFQNSWSSSPYGSYFSNPLSALGGLGGTDLSQVYGSSGPFGSLGSSYGYSPYSGYSSYPYSGYTSSPYSGYTSSPTDLSSTSPSSSIFDSGLFGSDSPFANMFGNTFKAKTYGPPPTQNITNALVGQRLNYNSGYMGIPLQYQLEKSDIGAITGTQYKNADAWKVRVGQESYLWDVILDETGNNILSESQVQQ
jgi:hypothetical protein